MRGTVVDELHERSHAWLETGATDDPSRDVAVHIGSCVDCSRDAMALDALGAIDVERAGMPVAPAEKACCAEAAKDHKSCCKDKTVDLQDKSDDVLVKIFSVSPGVLVPLQQWTPVQNPTAVPTVKEQVTSYYCDVHAPPLFKLYSQYTFYA